MRFTICCQLTITAHLSCHTIKISSMFLGFLQYLRRSLFAVLHQKTSNKILILSFFSLNIIDQRPLIFFFHLISFNVCRLNCWSNRENKNKILTLDNEPCCTGGPLFSWQHETPDQNHTGQYRETVWEQYKTLYLVFISNVSITACVHRFLRTDDRVESH